MQAPLLRSYYEPVASRNAVPAHRELHYSPVQCQPAVQQRVGIFPAVDLIVYCVPFLIGWLGHVDDDSKSSSASEIQITNRAQKWQRGLPKQMKTNSNMIPWIALGGVAVIGTIGSLNLLSRLQPEGKDCKFPYHQENRENSRSHRFACWRHCNQPQ